MKYIKSYEKYIIKESDSVDIESIEDMNSDELEKVKDSSKDQGEGLKKPIIVPAQNEKE